MRDVDPYDISPARRTTDPAAKIKRLGMDILSRWYWPVAGLVLGLLASSYYLSKAPKQYSSSTTLLIKQQTRSVINRDQVDEIDMGSTEGVNTAMERIRRIDLLERVATRQDVRDLPGLVPPPTDWKPDWVKKLGAKHGWLKPKSDQKQAVPSAQALGGQFSGWMRVGIRPGTRLVDIRFTHQVPEVAAALADAVAREYLAEIAGARTEGRSSSIDLLMKESEEARKKIQAAETAKASYTRSLEMLQQLDEQENQINQLSRRYLPKHPRMVASNSEFESLKSRFLQEFETAVTAPSDESYWRIAADQINASKGDPDAHLRTARQLLIGRTSTLQNEISSQGSVFNSMLTRIEETGVNQQGQETSAEVSSLARVSGWAASPQPQKIHGTGAMAGLTTGLLIAFLLVQRDNRFHSVSQLEAETAQPVLAAVADLNLRHLDQAARAQEKKSGPRLPDSEIQKTWDPRLLFRSTLSATTFAEMFRILRASISLLGDEEKRRITLFTSALPGEGKSLVSSNYALAAAGQRRKTLLIDLDLRKPSIHRVFGFKRSHKGAGITEWLAGQVELKDIIITETGADHLHLILAGHRAPNPGELLNASRIKQLLAEVSKYYDLVVLDTAPVLAVPDTRIIAPFVDNLCLVVRAGYVPKGAVNRTLDLLYETGNPPAGLVFNAYEETKRSIGYNYSYGNYKLNSYGRATTYGAYGAYGDEDYDDDEDIAKTNKKRLQKQKS